MGKKQKVVSLEISNIRLIKHELIEFDAPLMLFYGDIRQGKTTILDCIKSLFLSKIPQDFITKGERKGFVKLILENGTIEKHFRIDKHGVQKSDATISIIDSKKVGVKEIQGMINPIQLNQDFLKEMTGLERSRFFIDLFNVETKGIDNKIEESLALQSEFKRKCNAIGQTNYKKIERPNIKFCKDEIAVEKEFLLKTYESIKLDNDNKKSIYDSEIEIVKLRINDKNILIKSENDSLDEINYNLKKLQNSIFGNIEYTGCLDSLKAILETKCIQREIDVFREIDKIKTPEYLPTDNIDKSKYNILLEKFNLANQKMISYDYDQLELKKLNEFNLLDSLLIDIRETLSDLRKDKIKKLSEYGSEIKGLEFTETGSINYKGINIEQLSTSQIVELGSNLQILYKDNLLGIELIDRAESLGKSVFEFAEKAIRENSTILATIVSETPANAPSEVGVFFVENGEINIVQ